MSHYSSWNHNPELEPLDIVKLRWVCDNFEFKPQTSYLAYGNGRSYGDCCQNHNGTIIDTSGINHFIQFDPQTGHIKCEAGVKLVDILEIIVPHGWFLPVTPGTQFVTVGGAVANDVHGKNHHTAGNFGNHIKAFQLLRSDSTRIDCSLESNPDLFKATVGGLGLTGLILWVEFTLKKITNAYMTSSIHAFQNLQEFAALTDTVEQDAEYTVAWIDTMAKGENLGRGIYFSGNHAERAETINRTYRRKSRFIPFDMPGWTLNKWSVKAFNHFYYKAQAGNGAAHTVHYEPFFYPLDNILHWNRLYGKRGFYQYQCVVPVENGIEVVSQILQHVSKQANASFLSVLKKFGNIPSVGMLSFPRAGYTLALDFPNKAHKTLKMFDYLDSLVKEAGGAIYPAKDARMSAEMFHSSFPRLMEFEKHIDPAFSSSFWQRVNPA